MVEKVRLEDILKEDLSESEIPVYFYNAVCDYVDEIENKFKQAQTLYAIKDVESGEFVGYSHVFKCYELTDIRTAEFYSYPIHAENVVLAIKDRPTLIENKQIARFASSLKIVTLTVIEEVGE